MFNEQDWLKLIFLLNDTQSWLDEMSKEAFYQLPFTEKKKFMRKTYFLTLPVLTHILEKHYSKIPRHPQAAKFTIPVIEILHYIRDAYALPTTPVPGCLNFQRILDTGKDIGLDKKGMPVQVMTVITDGGGKIITAFPGLLLSSELLTKEMDTETPPDELASSNGAAYNRL
jgi:hypothetical protein